MNPTIVPTVVEAERRGENRRAVQTRATLTLLDGEGAGASQDILTRDLALSGISFFLNHPLTVGQNCRVELTLPGGNQTHACEVVRVRAVSAGRFEMAVQVRAKM